MTHLSLQGGVMESLAPLVGIGASLVLVLMVVALGAYAYRQLRGDGVEWPEDAEREDDELRRGDPDDEWDYY